MRFRFHPLAQVALALIGVRPSKCEVVVDARMFRASYGPWCLTTPVANIRDVCVTGPYRWWRAIGPRGSWVDRGATFGTNAQAGCCVTFHEPVGALMGPNRFLHPGLTVTVEDPDALAALLRRRISRADDSQA